MSQAQIGNLQVALGLNTAQFSAGIAQAQGSLATFGKSLKTFAAAAAGALSFAAVTTAVQSTINRMDELGKAAQKIGIPVDDLSRLEYAAKLADVSLDSLTTTMAKFSKSIAEVAAGGENDAGAALAAIGVSATDAEGKLRPTTAIMADIAEEFSVMRDSANKTALAIALFGKSGADMIPLLNGGREAISEASAELEQFGGVVTPEAAKQAEEFNDNITRLQTAFSGLLQEAIAPILPKLIELTQSLIELTKTSMPVGDWVDNLIAFFAELKPFIETTRKEIEGITAALRYLGLIDPAPLEINIPGGDLQVADGKGDKQTKDAPALPASGSTKTTKAAKPGTADDIYGDGFTDSLKDTQKTFDELWTEMESGIPTTNLLAESFQNMADTIADSLSTALVGLITGTQSVTQAFESMLQSISQMLEDLAAQIIKSQIFQLLGMLAGGIAGGGGAGINIGGMTFGGLYADGGHLGSGQWGIAGENGPEIIHGPANITPMDGMGGGSPQMNVTVINNSSAQVATRQGADGGLDVMIEDKIAAAFARGGNKIDSAIQKGYGLRRAGR